MAVSANCRFSVVCSLRKRCDGGGGLTGIAHRVSGCIVRGVDEDDDTFSGATGIAHRVSGCGATSNPRRSSLQFHTLGNEKRLNSSDLLAFTKQPRVY